MTVATSRSHVRPATARSFDTVLLAGALRPSPLRRTLNIPVLALPLSEDERLLDRWLTCIANTSGCRGLKIVLSSHADAKVVSKLIDARAQKGFALPQGDIEVIVDPKEWRGPAGLLRDISQRSDFSEQDMLIAAEAACLPPASLARLVDCMDERVTGVIGGSTLDEPAGLYAFRASVVASISPKGFCDIKEQLLPALHIGGKQVRSIVLCDRVIRIRDVESYLKAVQHTMSEHERVSSVDRRAEISPTAHIATGSLIQQDVIVGDGAVVHESVVMAGARIGGGAVVSQSVVASGATVGPRQIVRGVVHGGVASGTGDASNARRLTDRFAILSRVHGTTKRNGS